MTLKFLPERNWLLAGLCGLILFMSGCSSPPPPPPPVTIAPEVKPPPITLESLADTPLAYRKDAASHLYGKNRERIFQGIMPPFLYAIGVLQINIDSQGQLTSLNWMRPPLHAPEVITEIERTVREAAPFPAPVRLGQASYIDTWLWDASGRFQLHTLTEGQSWVVSGKDRPAPTKP